MSPIRILLGSSLLDSPPISIATTAFVAGIIDIVSERLSSLVSQVNSDEGNITSLFSNVATNTTNISDLQTSVYLQTSEGIQPMNRILQHCN